MFIDVQQKILSQHGGFPLPQASGDLGWNPTTPWEFQGCETPMPASPKRWGFIKGLWSPALSLNALFQAAILCVEVAFFIKTYPSNIVSSKSFPQGPRPKVYLVGGGLVELEEGTFKLPWWLFYVVVVVFLLKPAAPCEWNKAPWKLSRCHRF